MDPSFHPANKVEQVYLAWACLLS